MDIRNLKDTPRAAIYQTFINSFSNYFIPIPRDEELHTRRWQTSGVDFKLSYGASENGELVAFILHSPQGDSLFNLATGVLPSHRGQGVIQKIYEKSLPELRAQGFISSKLEVITENTRAIRAYEKVGFKSQRKLISFRGKIPLLSSPLPRGLSYDVCPVSFNDSMRRLIQYPYSTEHSENIVLRKKNELELHLIREGQELLAYAIFSPRSLSFSQIEATGNLEYHLTLLLHEMKLSDESIRMTNIDERRQDLIGLWTRWGLGPYISQYEMICSI